MKNINIIEGNITQAKVDAIVNAANPKMLGGGGGDGAIHQAAGPSLLSACRKVKSVNGIRCPFGCARITRAGELDAEYVLHAVGPIYRNESDPDGMLRRTYTRILALASEYSCKTIAIPAISCGAYGFPIDRAAKIAIETCLSFPNLSVYFYLMDRDVVQSWCKTMEEQS